MGQLLGKRAYLNQMEKVRRDSFRMLERRIDKAARKKHPPQFRELSVGRDNSDRCTRNFIDNTLFKQVLQEIWDKISFDDRRNIVIAMRVSSSDVWNVNDLRNLFYERVVGHLFSKSNPAVLPYVLPMVSMRGGIYLRLLRCVKSDVGSSGGNLYCCSGSEVLDAGDVFYWTSHAIDQARDRLGLSNCLVDIGPWVSLLFCLPELDVGTGHYVVRFDGVVALFLPFEDRLVEGRRVHVIKTALLPGYSGTPVSVPFVSDMVPGRVIPGESFELLVEFYRLVWGSWVAREEFLRKLNILY